MPRKLIHVAAGALKNSKGEILLAKRAAKAHQGGLWEFPGGKLEPGETVYQALVRELREELGIAVTKADPLIRLRHDYDDLSVILDVWLVPGFNGEPHGCENQPLAWVPPTKLTDYPMPAADKPIVSALCLPRQMAITADEPFSKLFIEKAAIAGESAGLLQLRAHDFSTTKFQSACHELGRLAAAQRFQLVINTEPSSRPPNDHSGLHLTSVRLRQMTSRPQGWGGWIGASCHDRDQLQKAIDLGLDYAVLSPVKTTQSHPDALPLGWQTFEALIGDLPIPVFALGGLSMFDYPTSLNSGAQGIAGIRQFWPSGE